MMKKLLERIAKFTQSKEAPKQAPKAQTRSRKTAHSKPRVHKPAQGEVMTLEQRIGSLEKALEAHKLEIAQMKGEFTVEMRYAKTNEAREEIKNAYYGLKEEAAIYAKGLMTQLQELQKQAAKA